MNSEAQTWRELLGDVIRDPQEKERIANELGVRPITLMRWVNNDSIPRLQNLRHLVRILPEQRELLAQLIGKEFSDFIDSGSAVSFSSEMEQIPAPFYTSVLHMNGTTPPSLRFWSIARQVISQALNHLDPDHVGIQITVTQCTRPQGNNGVRTLREMVEMGTLPWPDTLEEKDFFQGAESLAGYAVTTGRSLVIQDLREANRRLPAHDLEYLEASATACPLLRAGGVAGCLLVSCTQAGYFVSSRLTLIEMYADLLSLAFEDADFFSLEEVKLGNVPGREIQEKYFSGFRQRIARVMEKAFREKQPMTTVQAEQIVWHQLEEELLQALYRESETASGQEEL